MSSPAGAASGANGGGDAGQAQGEANGQAQQGPDLNALAEQLNGQNASLEQMREFLQSQPWSPQEQQQEAAPESEAPNFDLSGLENAGYTEDEIGQISNSLAEQVQAEVSRQVQAQIKPLDDRLTEREFAEKAYNVASKYPELQKPEVVKEVQEAAEAYFTANDLPLDWLHEPAAIGLMYAAMRGHALEADEGSEQPAAAHLEGGAGASGASQASEGDQWKQMLESSGGGNYGLPFS